MAKIVVFGSFVVDLMGRSPHLPVPGETVKGNYFKMGPGGKGFNQAVAAHKAGGEVVTITKLGQDSFAQVALDTMDELGMDNSHVLRTADTETGCALILVDEGTGQNEIVVILGACNTFDDSDIRTIEPLLRDADYLLTQLETNVDAVEKVVDIACANNVKVILNTAPVQPVSDALLSKVDIITPNEVEAEILTGVGVDSEDAAVQAAKWFFEKGVGSVVITLGGRGVFLMTKDGRHEILPVPEVPVLDTTGAGDAFNGGLVCALAEGKDLWGAARFANGLASLAVQRMGTTTSMPTREEIDAFLREHNM